MTEAKGPSVGPSAPSVQRLVIDRSRWLRGEGDSYSKLLRTVDGKMCCLGFYALACGLTTERISDTPTPRRAPDPLWPGWLFGGTDGRDPHVNSAASEALMKANDESGDEARIAALFAEHGVEVVFTDGEASAASARNAPPETSRAGSTEGKEKP